jgi:hypothetical protein
MLLRNGPEPTCARNAGLARWLPGKRLDPEKDERRRGERREQCEARQLLPRRHSRELLFDEFEIVGDRVQVATAIQSSP